MFVEVKDPDEKVCLIKGFVSNKSQACLHFVVLICLSFLGFQVILSRQYGSEGRFIFTSHTPGEHQICLHSNSSKFALFAGGMLVSLFCEPLLLFSLNYIYKYAIKTSKMLQNTPCKYVPHKLTKHCCEELNVNP